MGKAGQAGHEMPDSSSGSRHSASRVQLQGADQGENPVGARPLQLTNDNDQIGWIDPRACGDLDDWFWQPKRFTRLPDKKRGKLKPQGKSRSKR